jgi:hypothetical protein
MFWVWDANLRMSCAGGEGVHQAAPSPPFYHGTGGTGSCIAVRLGRIVRHPGAPSTDSHRA